MRVMTGTNLCYSNYPLVLSYSGTVFKNNNQCKQKDCTDLETGFLNGVWCLDLEIISNNPLK